MAAFDLNRTSDLSASMTCSSVVAALEETSSTSAQEALAEIETDGPSDTQTLINPILSKLLINLFQKGEYESVVTSAGQLLSEFPESIFLHNIMAESYSKLGHDIKAIFHYEQALDIKPCPAEQNMQRENKVNYHNNVAVSLKSLGLLERSEQHLKAALKINPLFSPAYNNYGNLLNDRADIKGAQDYFLKAIDIDENSFRAYWNLHSTVSNTETAQAIVEMCLKAEPMYRDAIFTLAGMNAFKGDRSHFDSLMNSELSDDPILKSIEWVLSLKEQPSLHFNRWKVFDLAVSLSDRSRPFYEFGVWMGDSFRYLMKSYKKGFGFDTFEGLPEDWRSVPKGSYSSFGKVPDVPGGEFIVGEFDKTLPSFFASERPKAALINLDADLYGSTLSALKNARSIIDEQTVIIFDELIINQGWQQDEFKALNEFCALFELQYEVLAVSLYTKQVVTRVLPAN
jgi:tetratricopeptide (TPR) repeat protein